MRAWTLDQQDQRHALLRGKTSLLCMVISNNRTLLEHLGCSRKPHNAWDHRSLSIILNLFPDNLEIGVQDPDLPDGG